MTPQEFIAKWQPVELKERSACQEHFLDLCELLGQPKPAAADPGGAWYCFERGPSKTEGGQGWADVWMYEHFGWEEIELPAVRILRYDVSGRSIVISARHC
jgi:hypothetical protein